MGRNAAGVIGIRLDDDNDRVVGMICVDPEDNEVTVLVVSENGNGKRSELDEYRITNRGGKGVKTMNINDKTGPLIGLKAVSDMYNLVIINKTGLTLRIYIAYILMK